MCESCAIGKAIRQPFPKKSTSKTSAPLELIHSDVAGPLEKGPGSELYFLTFIDDYTRYCKLYLIRNKGESLRCFQDYVAKAEKFHGAKLKRVRTDNGTEFGGNRIFKNQFDEFCSRNGIQHDRTVPYSPQQNGVAESKNKVLVNAVRSMLNDAGLPKSYWTFAIKCANFVFNNTVSGVTNKIPAFEFYGRSYPLKDLQIFGTTVYAWIPSSTRTKLDDRSEKAIFLGYSEDSKGYIIQGVNNIGTNSTRVCRDVAFTSEKIMFAGDDDEDEVAGTSSSKKSSKNDESEVTDTDIIEPLRIIHPVRDAERSVDRKPVATVNNVIEPNNNESDDEFRLTGDESDDSSEYDFHDALAGQLNEQVRDDDSDVNAREVEPRRSQREVRAPERYDPSANVLRVLQTGVSVEMDPASIAEALRSPDREKWIEAFLL